MKWSYWGPCVSVKIPNYKISEAKPENERGQYRWEAPQGKTPGDTSKIYPYSPIDQIYHYSHILCLSQEIYNSRPPPPPPPTILIHLYIHIHVQTLRLILILKCIYTSVFLKLPSPSSPSHETT